MLLLDFISHVLLCYFLISLQSVPLRTLERWVLAVAFALVLKSLIVFLTLTFGMTLRVIDQVIAGWIGVLLLGWRYFRLQKIPVIQPRGSFQEIKNPVAWVVASLVVGLFLASLYFLSVFPITISDGIWYHLRGMTFFHESDLASQVIDPQYRAYPPYIPLLYAWMLSMGQGFLTWIFPLFYLALLLVLFCRILAMRAPRNLAWMFTGILATAPYFWWHSLQPILNLTAGFYFSVGLFFAYSLFEEILNENQALNPHPARGYALLSGLGFGVAAWTRPEFLLYGAIPWVFLMYLISRREFARQGAKEKIFVAFACSLLALPTVWSLFLLKTGMELPASSMGVMAVTFGMWMVTGAFLWGFRRCDSRFWTGLGLILGLIFILGLMSGSRTGLTPGQALLMGIYRSLGFNAFYSFLWVFVFLILFSSWRRWPRPLKYFGGMLVSYWILHFMMYTLLPLKSTSVAQYFDTIRISPGDAVNSPDTRELLAFYPALLFFTTFLPKVRKAFP